MQVLNEITYLTQQRRFPHRLSTLVEEVESNLSFTRVVSCSEGEEK